MCERERKLLLRETFIQANANLNSYIIISKKIQEATECNGPPEENGVHPEGLDFGLPGPWDLESQVRRVKPCTETVLASVCGPIFKVKAAPPGRCRQHNAARSLRRTSRDCLGPGGKLLPEAAGTAGVE